jgi:hypothetical protein
MAYELTGKLYKKYNTKQVTTTFKKREFVLEISEEINGNIYTNYAKMQLVQNKCVLIDSAETGSTLTVSFNIKGTKYDRDGKEEFITNLDVWKVEQVNGNQNTPANVPAKTTPFTPPSYSIDDLPF